MQRMNFQTLISHIRKECLWLLKQKQWGKVNTQKKKTFTHCEEQQWHYHFCEVTTATVKEQAKTIVCARLCVVVLQIRTRREVH